MGKHGCAFALVLTLLAAMVLPVQAADINEALHISRQAQALERKGDLGGAARLADQAIEVAKSAGAEGTAAFALLLNRRAWLFTEAGRFMEAEALYRRAIELRAAVDPDARNTSLNDLAVTLRRAGRYAGAEAAYKEIIASASAAKPINPEYLATMETNLGLLYRDTGNYADAEPLLRQALARRELLPPEQRGDYVANSHNILAYLLKELGRYAEAEKHVRQALVLFMANHGPGHAEVATAQNVLGDILRVQGQFDEAKEVLEQALTVRRKVYGAASPRVATTLNSLGALAESQGRVKDAEALYREALKIREATLAPQNPDHPDLATTRANLGDLLKAGARYDEGEVLLRLALASREKVFGARHPDTVRSMLSMADLLQRRGRRGEADTLFEDARSLRRAAVRSITVYYGTDRTPDTRSGVTTYGSDQAQRLSTGVATVWVTEDSTSGSAAPPANAATKQAPARRAAAEESTALRRIIIRSITPAQRAEDVAASARQTLSGAQLFSRQALMFVHGFNVSFDNAVKRAAQIAYDLSFDGPVFVYAWPSRGGDTFWEQIVRVLAYTDDRNRAESARQWMNEFMRTVITETGAEQVHFIAHSMGNKALLEALRLNAMSPGKRLDVGEIVFAAPDVERVQFGSIIWELRQFNSRKTLYASTADRALFMSRFVWQGTPAGYFTKRQGPLVVGGVETIDISAAGDSLLSLNHDVFASNPAITNDIRLLLRDALHPPDKRARLERVDGKDGPYWVYRKSTQETQ